MQEDQWTPSGERVAVMYKMTAMLSNSIGDRITIELLGWALAYVADESVWIDGVHPGACTASGKDLKSAIGDLQSTLSKILLDIALSSNESDIGFDGFAREVNSFVASSDEATLQDWKSAQGDSKAEQVYVKITLEQVQNPTPPDASPEPLLNSLLDCSESHLHQVLVG